MKINREIILIASSFTTLVIAAIWYFKTTGKLDWNSFEPLIVMVGAIIAAASSLLSSRILKKKEKKIFISYSQLDVEFVSKLIEILRENGFNVSDFNEVVSIGDNIHKSLEIAIKDSDLVIGIFSDSSPKSDYFKYEIDESIKQDKKVLPIQIGDSLIPKELSHVRHAKVDSTYQSPPGIIPAWQYELINSIKNFYKK